MTGDDQDFLDRQARYTAHMDRFRAAHAAMPETMRDVLVELERRERWTQIMGKYAAVLEPPAMLDAALAGDAK